MIQEINLQGSEEGRVGQREKLTCSEVVPEASADPTECSRDGMGLHSCGKSRQRARTLYSLHFSERLLMRSISKTL